MATFLIFSQNFLSKFYLSQTTRDAWQSPACSLPGIAVLSPSEQ